jgi:nitrogen fixation/metabolism regulation signal transduction histidine kinase
MCLVVALLPAMPLTFVVQSLLDKSFDVGLHPNVDEALQSGLAVSRDHLNAVRRDFHLHVQRTAVAIGDASEARPDSARAAAALARVVGASGAIDGLAVSTSRAGAGGGLPVDLQPFEDHPMLMTLLDATKLIDRPGERRSDYAFFDVEDRSSFVAVWNPRGADGDYRVLFYKRVDPEFLAHANRLIEQRQIFAELKLTRRSLTESFFFPFVIIYAVCLVVALGLALVMAERMADPIRRLVRGTDKVAGGDWNYRLDVETGGETGRLVDAFNAMVRRLESQHRRLTDLEKMATWREMARHLAHEIKNPLLPIRLTVEELRDQYKGGDAAFKGMLEDSARVVGDELGSLNKLVKEFSTFAKMPDMTPAPGSLEKLVRDVTQMYPQVESSVEAAEPLPDFPFDTDQIRRVLINLFDNAASVGASRVAIAVARTDGEAVLTLADNGPGIAADMLGRIFDPYFTTRQEGTGLGLAMVKKIVLLHGGEITAASREGEGVTFEVRLPLSGPQTQKEEK